MGSGRGQRKEGACEIERQYRPYFVSGALPAVVVLVLSVFGFMVTPAHALSHETSPTNFGWTGTGPSLPHEPSAMSSTNWSILQNIPTGSGLEAAIFDNKSGDLFVPMSTSDSVAVISGSSNKVLATLPLGGGGGAQPQVGGIDDTANGLVYVPVARTGWSFVSVISGTKVLANVTTGSGTQLPAYDPYNGYVYATNYGSSNWTVISGTTSVVNASGTATGAFSGVGGYPHTPTVASNKNIYVAGQLGVAVFSGTSNRVIVNISDTYLPQVPTFDPANGDLYVPNTGGNANNISVISTASNTIIANIAVGGQSVPDLPLYDPANGDIYVPNYNSKNVSVISGATNKVVATISVGGGAVSPVLDPQTGDIFVSNQLTYNVSVISGATNQVIATVAALPAVAATPYPAAYDSINHRLYVSDLAASNVSVVGQSAPGPVISSFIATPNPIVLGNGTTFKINASGGTGSLTYMYFNLPPPCVTANSSTLSCTPTARGVYWVNATVTDGIGMIARAGMNLTVNPSGVPPSITSFVASPNPVGVNQLTYLNVTATGGSAPLSYVYRGLPTGCATSNTNALACTPTVTGNFSVRVYVNDTAGRSANKVLALAVTTSLPRITSVTVSPSSGSAQTGGKIYFNATPICSPNPCPAGTSYSWSLAPTSLGTLNRSSGTAVSFTAGATPRTGTLWVNGTLNAVTVSSSVLIQVGAPPSPTIQSFVASPSFLTLGQGTVFTVQTSGGALLARAASPLTSSATLHYAYSGLPPGCVSANASSLSCTPTAVGKFNVTVNVTDRLGRSALARTPLNVNSSASGANGGFSFLGFHGLAAYGAAAGVGGGVAAAGGGVFMMRGKLIRLRGGKGGSQVSSGGVAHQVSGGGVAHQVSGGGVSHQVSGGGVSHGPAQGTPPAPPPTSPPSAP